MANLFWRKYHYSLSHVLLLKSWISAAVIDHLKELQLDSTRTCFHYFFDANKTSPDPLSAMLRALIKQVLELLTKQVNTLPKEIETELFDMFNGTRAPPSIDNLASLLLKLINKVPRALYLMDGFDHLNEVQIQKFFSVLRTVFGELNSHGSKIALFSRETLGKGIDIEKQLSTLTRIHILRLTLDHLSADIERYVEAQVNEQELKRTLSTNTALVSEIKAKLKAHSDKM